MFLIKINTIFYIRSNIILSLINYYESIPAIFLFCFFIINSHIFLLNHLLGNIKKCIIYSTNKKINFCLHKINRIELLIKCLK